ncbi:hypothetical protein Salat_0182600 [Sesamum alatum]|uniref:Uncharacterized protein n=1 Tax=Sesamum alatum TaxID=300844 RepID=A0AAE2CXU7_9LAMI|nr:hypothetical protein Salat_0182600 [Sesamum alatum]
MESDILKLDSALSLTEEEATSVVIPQSDWDKGVDGYRFTLVGRLLSHRSIHFEALKGRLIQLIQGARGYSSSENLGGPILFGSLSQPKDPLSISLDWCPFFVHVHDLRLGQRSVDVLRYIGDYVGAWLDAGNMERDIFWFENVRIRLNINVSDCFVDPGANYPFGAWLLVTGPMRRVGGTLDSICPTYVWSSHRTTSLSGDQRRGAQIFGNFWLAQGVASSSSPRVPIATTTILVQLGQQCAAACGKEGGQQFWQLIDKETDSSDLGRSKLYDLGLECGMSLDPGGLSVSSRGPPGSRPEFLGNGPTNMGHTGLAPIQRSGSQAQENAALVTSSSSQRISSSNLVPLAPNPALSPARSPMTSESPTNIMVVSSPTLVGVPLAEQINSPTNRTMKGWCTDLGR